MTVGRRCSRDMGYLVRILLILKSVCWWICYCFTG